MAQTLHCTVAFHPNATEQCFGGHHLLVTFSLGKLVKICDFVHWHARVVN